MANSSADTVEANAVYLRDIQATISFSSNSDALFAAFVSRYPNLQWYIVDDLLTMFHDVSFLSNDVTFKCAEDIPDRIAKERRSLASARESRQYQPSLSLKAKEGLPIILVELIAEQVHSERRAFVDTGDEVRFFFNPMMFDTDPDETLHAMSLVHPSWTGIAQRCLRRRITVSKRSELERLFRSPQLGPWVQEFAFCDDETESRAVGHYPEEVERMLCGILQRCSNLKHLYIEAQQLPFNGAIATSSCRILQQLGCLLSLEGLWLHRPGRHPRKYLGLVCRPGKVIDFWDFYTTISKLKALKIISLVNLGFYVSTDVDVVNAHRNVTPSASLQSISIIDITAKRALGVPLMSRLIQPRNTFRPSCLDVDFDLLESFLPGKEKMMTSIKKLRVRIENHDLEELSNPLEHCLSLSSLSLHIVNHDLLNATHPVLPATVFNLSIYFEFLLDAEESFEVESSFLIPMLARYPQVKKIIIYAKASALAMTYNEFVGGPYLETGWDPSEPLPFNDTQIYCGNNNVGFKLILAENTPPFLDHTCDSTNILVDPSRPEVFVLSHDVQIEEDGDGDEDEDDMDEDTDEAGEGLVD